MKQHKHKWVPIPGLQHFPQRLCKCGTIKMGTKTVLVGDRIRFDATNQPAAVGEMGMDITTGRPRIFVSGSVRDVAHTGDASGYATVKEEGTAQTVRTVLNFVGRSVIADDSASETRVRVSDFQTMFYDSDDLAYGTGAVGAIGKWGWGFFGTGTGTRAAIASTAGRPGLYQLSTGTTSGSLAELYNDAIASQNLFPADTFDTYWYFKLNQVGTGQVARVGWGDNVASNPPANGIYIEKLSADTTWFLVTRVADVQTRVDTTFAESTAYIRVRLRRVNGTTIGATVDAGTEVTSTTNIPTVAINPMFAIRNTAAADKVMVADGMEWLTTGLSR